MPIDARIPMGVQPVELPDFASLAVKRAAVQNSMVETATRQRALNEQNALAGLMQDPTFDIDNPESMQRGLRVAPNLFPDLAKNVQAQRLAKQQTEDAAWKAKITKQQESMQHILTMRTSEEAAADIQDRVAKGELDKARGDSLLAHIADKDWRDVQLEILRGFVGAGPNPEKLLETDRAATDLNDRVQVDTTPKYGAPVGREVLDKGQSPDAVLRASQDRATSQRPFVVGGQDGTATVLSPDGTHIIATYDGVGKPSSGFEKAQGERAALYKNNTAARGVIDQLLAPNSAVDKAGGGGLTIAATGAARAVGATTDNMKAMAELGPLGQILLYQVPRFEGPQSDKDVITYKDAAGKLTNEWATPAEKRAALTVIKGLLDKTDQYLKEHPQEGAAMASTGSAAEWVRDPKTGKLRPK